MAWHRTTEGRIEVITASGRDLDANPGLKRIEIDRDAGEIRHIFSVDRGEGSGFRTSDDWVRHVDDDYVNRR